MMQFKRGLSMLRNAGSFIFPFVCLFLACPHSIAQEVVITPDKVQSPNFRTSDAICYGNMAYTHINLGFGSSETGLKDKDMGYCTVAGGISNKATSGYSTVGGGNHNTASSLSVLTS